MDRSLISQAIEALELSDIYLYSSSISRTEDITESDYPETMYQQNKLGLRVDFIKPEEPQESFEQVIHAKVDFGLRLVVSENKEDDEPQVLSEIEACFFASYIQMSEASEEAISEFIKHNIVHNVWPFWREHAFRLSAEARLPKPMISLFKDQPTPD